jgi:hypothetical protein
VEKIIDSIEFISAVITIYNFLNQQNLTLQPTIFQIVKEKFKILKTKLKIKRKQPKPKASVRIVLIVKKVS